MESSDALLSDRLTAVHEAGHAVVALAVGRQVHRVSILPNQTRLGVCELKKGRAKPSGTLLEDEIVILLAGVAAEGRLTGHYDWNAGARDIRYADQLIESRAATAKQVERMRRRMMDRVEHLLDGEATWAAVEVIADQLIQHRTISGRAAKHFYAIEMARDSS
jgi:ATP-dependent Zn protease